MGNNSNHYEHHILASSNDAIVCKDLAATITFWNKAAERLLGYTEEEAVGSKISLIIPEIYAAEEKQLVERILWGETIENYETERIHKNGSMVHVSISLSPIIDETGKIIGISKVARATNDRRMLESKSQALLESAPDAMVIVNKSGQIVLVNAQTEKLFEYSRDELIGQEVEMLIPSRFLAHHAVHRKDYFTEPKVRGMGIGMELYGKRKSGLEFPVEISLSPLKTESGKFVSAAIRDITQRKKAEDKFKALMESAPDATVIVNRQGIIQLINAQTEKIFGYEKSELVGQKVEVLIPGRFKEKHPHHRDGFFSNPNVRPMGAAMELWAVKKNGEEFPVEISLSPLETEEGLLVSASIRDVTERKKVNQELQKLNKSQRETIDIVSEQNKRLINFAHIVSHNLRSHSGNFGMLLNLYKDENNLEEKEHLFHLLENASGQMMETINNLNEVVTVQININQQRKKIKLKEAIQKIEESISTEISQHNTAIHIDIPDDLEIEYASSYLDSIILNFLTNGIKYRHPDRSPLITFKTYTQDQRLVLEINDNGLGIDLEKHRDKLFGMYKTFHGNKDAKGLGLFITKNQVEAMGGKIDVESKVNVGTTFKVFLS